MFNLLCIFDILSVLFFWATLYMYTYTNIKYKDSIKHDWSWKESAYETACRVFIILDANDGQIYRLRAWACLLKMKQVNKCSYENAEYPNKVVND